MVIKVNSLKDKAEELKAIKVNTVDPTEVGVNAIVSNDDDVEFDCDVSVEMEKKVYDKIMTYARLTDEEIAGIGYVEQVEKNRFEITEIYLPKQTVSKARCVCDIDDQCRIMQELIDQGKNPGNLKMWWHSHNSMGTFWSGQDDHTGFISACDYFISIVVNHKMELRCKVNICTPVEIVVDNVPVTIISKEIGQKVIDDCTKEMEGKVFEKHYVTQYNKNNNNGYDGYHPIGFHNNLFDYDDQKLDEKETAEQEDKDANSNVYQEDEFPGKYKIIQAPYGLYFQVGVYMFTWNAENLEYDVTDGNGHVLHDTQLLDRDEKLLDYARPYSEDEKLNGLYNGA